MIPDVAGAPASMSSIGSTIWITIGGADGRLVEYVVWVVILFFVLMLVVPRGIVLSVSGWLVDCRGNESTVGDCLVIVDIICWMMWMMWE